MAALALWLVFPHVSSFFKKIGLIHPIYFCWITSLATFFLVAVIDKRKIKNKRGTFSKVPSFNSSSSSISKNQSMRDENF